MSSPLRVAVIGAGVMGRHHINVYQQLPDVQVVGVVEPDSHRAREISSSFGVQTYPTVDALLAAGRVDAASVAAPTSTHHPITHHLLRSGVHVLVEKPVATRVEDAQDLASFSRAQGLVLQVGHITRFFRAVERLRQEVGEPYLIEARRLSPNGRIQDVGVVLDLMIHDIDIVLGLVRQPVVDIAVAGHIVNGGPHEDVCAAQVRFADGCIARFLASRVAPDAERTLVIAEAGRTFRVDFGKEPHTEMTVYEPAPARSNREDGSSVLASHVLVDRQVVFEDNPLRKQLSHFLARVRGMAQPIGTLDNDIASLSLAQELLDRLRQQQDAQLAREIAV